MAVKLELFIFIRENERILKDIEKTLEEYESLLNKKIGELKYGEEKVTEEEVEKVVEDIKNAVEKYDKVLRDWLIKQKIPKEKLENIKFRPRWLRILMNTKTFEEAFDIDDGIEKVIEFDKFRKMLNKKIKEKIDFENRIEGPLNTMDIIAEGLYAIIPKILEDLDDE